MPIVHLLSRTEQFLEVHPEFGATSERYSVLKDHPIRKLPQSLVYLNTHFIDTMNIIYRECIRIIQKCINYSESTLSICKSYFTWNTRRNIPRMGVTSASKFV